MCLMPGLQKSISSDFSVFHLSCLSRFKRLHPWVFAALWLSVWPLSAALAHACMSWWPGEGCVSRFNIPSLTGDVCKGFSLFLFFHFPSQSLFCTISVSIFLTVLWERGITLCIILHVLRRRSLKPGLQWINSWHRVSTMPLLLLLHSRRQN